MGFGPGRRFGEGRGPDETGFSWSVHGQRSEGRLAKAVDGCKLEVDTWLYPYFSSVGKRWDLFRDEKEVNWMSRLF